MQIFILNIGLILLSILTLVIANYRTKNQKIFLLLLLTCIILDVIYLTANHFSNDGVNRAVIAHLDYLWDFESLLRFWYVTFTFILIISFLITGFKSLQSSIGKIKISVSATMTQIARHSTPVLILITFLINPLTLDFLKIYQLKKLDNTTKLPEEFRNIERSAPPIAHTALTTTPNFIIVFAESLESTFLDPKIYPRLMPNLQKLIADKGFQIHGVKELTLSNWTDSGLTAALCGISMKPSYSDFGIPNSEITEKIKTRIAATDIIGESCVGDFLVKDGYELSFYGGSEFGRRSKTLLFKSQGFKNIFMTEEIIGSKPELLPTTIWGTYDDALFSFTADNIKKTDNEKPFGHVVLTVDTHTPGYVSPSCNKQKYGFIKSPLLNAVKCADQLISDFIIHQLTPRHQEETVIFLISDHLYPGKLPEYLSSRETRDNLFVVFNSRISNSEPIKSITRSATSLDIGATIMAHLGYDIKTLNFGRNLMYKHPTLAESLGQTTLSRNIVHLRHLMNDHWKHKQAELSN